LGPLEQHLKTGMLALDAGCGDGKTTVSMARKCDVVGCDFSREALVTLRSERERDGIVDLVECSVTRLPFGSEKFDAIACVHTLSHMPLSERSVAASELSRVLASGGYMLVEGFGKGDIRFGDGTEVEDSSFMRGNGIVTHYFQEGELLALFEALEPLQETGILRRVSFGAIAGRRDVRRALLRKA